MKEGLRCRVICETDGNLLTRQYAHARHYNALLCAFEGTKANYLDTQIYKPSHLLFTARPHLTGIDDPHPVRAFLVAGEQRPVQLDAMPELVDVTITSDYKPSDGLPALVGFGIGTGDSNHSINALTALGRLKAHMGERWEDTEERQRLWHQMLKNAGATEYELRTYGDFVDRRARDARAPSNERTVKALRNPDHSIPLTVAEERLKVILKNFVQSTEPRVVAVNMSMGIGKTTELLRQVGPEHRYWEHQSPLNNFNVDFYAPTIALAEDVQARAEELSIPSFVEYGRKQTFDGKPVCAKARASEAIEGYVDSVAEHLCDDYEGNVCPFRIGCRWQDQRTSFKDKWLRVRAHNHLGLPAITDPNHPAFRPVNMVVIDEASFVDALIHIQWVEIKDLIAPRLRGDDYRWALRFAGVVEQGLSLERLEEEGFTEEVFRQLIRAEEELRPIVDVNPAMSVEQSVAAVEGYDPSWYRFASVWRRLRDCLVTRSMNRVRVSSDYLVMAWKSGIKNIPWDSENDRPKVPVLILSGTMCRKVIEQFIRIDEWHEIEVEPHPDAVIEQSDLRGSKSECLYGSTEKRREDGETDPQKIKSAESVREIVAKVAGERPLITYKELAEQVRTTGWFYAIAGRNDWKGLNLVVYGRPLAHFLDVEDQARAIFCDDRQPIEHLRGQWYPRRRVARRGYGYGEMEYHPDARVEAVRWRMCEGEIMQAIGRSRYLRYPVNVLILSETVLPLRIDRVVSRHRLHPEWRAFEQSRVIPMSVREMARLWPTICADHRTGARLRDERRREVRDWLLVEYRRNPRAKWSKALVDDTSALTELDGIVESRLAETAKNDRTLARREFIDMVSWAPILVHKECVKQDWGYNDWETEDVPLRMEPDEKIWVGDDREGEDIWVHANELPPPVPWPWRRPDDNVRTVSTKGTSKNW